MAFTRLGKLLTQNFFNAILDRLEASFVRSTGRGVLSGCTLSAGTGLTVNIASGWIVATAPTEIAAVAGTPVPPSTTTYVFISSSGIVTTSASIADPGGEVVCLGSVVTSGSAVTEVRTTGRVSLQRWTGFREWQVGESQLRLNLESRETFVAGSVHLPFEKATITATRVLTKSAALIQRLQCASGQKVLLPDPSTVTQGFRIEIYNDNGGGGASIDVRDHGDSTTIASVAADSNAIFSLNFAGSGWIAR